MRPRLPSSTDGSPDIEVIGWNANRIGRRSGGRTYLVPSRFTEESLRTLTLLTIIATGVALPVSGQTKPAVKIITAVSAAVDVPSYQGGPCPAKLNFTGTIVADKLPTVPITYQWVRSDTSAKSPVRTLTMTGKGAIVTDSWSVGSSGEMMRVWNELRVLSPNAIRSEKVSAAILCH